MWTWKLLKSPSKILYQIIFLKNLPKVYMPIKCICIIGWLVSFFLEKLFSCIKSITIFYSICALTNSQLCIISLLYSEYYRTRHIFDFSRPLLYIIKQKQHYIPYCTFVKKIPGLTRCYLWISRFHVPIILTQFHIEHISLGAVLLHYHWS